ncbi:MAG: acetyl-CoA synthase subunit gamma [Bacteroidetes bacterium CG23_combo_of_CG06-09_8_20_14_all_32_9]|nr:MAG: acetyl-CoA synthase subunit gamma [Bacteroidetes bacterium CG23_combo_of_CG06-09_8_20_14_all_32_9]
MYYIKNYISLDFKVPVVSTVLEFKDIIGAIKTRWSINRNNYKVNPGLYAVGMPDKTSEIFVSANYKLSFDHLRRNLNKFNAWVLVLDTKGINVWCAAGKGTFGTNELISKIKNFSISDIVEHKRIIVPQLGAVGVSAHEVKKETGFNVKYGPVRASDIKVFLENKYRSDEKMRTVNFGFTDRLKLTPVEMVGHFKYFLLVLASFFILSGFKNASFSVDNTWNYGIFPVINLIVSYIAGTVITPVLLPWIPVRNFSFKGLLIGAILTFTLFFLNLTGNNVPETISWFLINMAIASFTAMNFTGSSTFTSLSGVKKEMKVAVPLQIIMLSVGFIMWLTIRFI